MIDQPRCRAGIASAVRGLTLAAFRLAALALAAEGEAFADQAAPAVAQITHVCSSCHGLQGQSKSSLFPQLAGQQRDYLVTQLNAFRDHTRADPHARTYMWGMAARLTDTQIGLIADYYAGLTPATGDPDPTVPMAAGEQIYTKGIPSAKVTACATCHGTRAEGKGATPRLAGQHPEYLSRQLEWFASKARANQIMNESSKNLTPEQIAAVTAYLGSK